MQLTPDYSFLLTAWKALRHFLLVVLAAVLVSIQAPGTLDAIIKNPKILTALILAAALEALRNTLGQIEAGPKQPLGPEEAARVLQYSNLRYAPPGAVAQ